MSHGNHRNVQKWTVLPRGHNVSRGNLWDTVRHGKLSHRQYCMCVCVCVVCMHVVPIPIFCLLHITLFIHLFILLSLLFLANTLSKYTKKLHTS